MLLIKHQFNSSASTFLHIDLNSCFATIEQQANPLLRGKPIAVAAYTTPRGCILAPSIEAKRFGVKTGMQVREGKMLCPNLIILSSDPPKYRFVNRAFLKLFSEYSPRVSVRSIDEMLLNFDHLVTGNTLVVKTPRECAHALSRGGGIKEALAETMTPPRWKDKQPSDTSDGGRPSLRGHDSSEVALTEVASEIKTRIKQEIGEWLTVSIGISTNPYLAKLAAGLHKPDGLDEINQHNILSILSSMKLVDLPYIKERNELRLNRVGVKTPVDFYFTSIQQLKAAFESINGYYWHRRLHGYSVDEVEWQRRSVGHSYALPKFTNDRKELERLLCKLVEKMGMRLRKNRWTAQGIHLACEFADWSSWHKGHKTSQKMYASSDLFQAAIQLLDITPLEKKVRVLAVSCFSLAEDLYLQTTLFRDEEKKRALTKALDTINERWGEFVVVSGTMMGMRGEILDRISFGGVRDLPRMHLEQEPKWEYQSIQDV